MTGISEDFPRCRSPISTMNRLWTVLSTSSHWLLAYSDLWVNDYAVAILRTLVVRIGKRRSTLGGWLETVKATQELSSLWRSAWCVGCADQEVYMLSSPLCESVLTPLMALSDTSAFWDVPHQFKQRDSRPWVSRDWITDGFHIWWQVPLTNTTDRYTKYRSRVDKGSCRYRLWD